MSRHKFSRRKLLAGLAAGIAATPLVPLFNSSAQETTIPRRVIFLFSANGTIHENWKPSGGETDFTFGEILQPLTPYQEYVNVLDGLRFSGGGAGNNHMAGPFRFMAGSGLLAGSEFTGGGNASSGWGGHISVDQHIANTVGEHTPFGSLELGVQNGSANPRSRMSYKGSNQPIAPEDDPYKAFDRLFADFETNGADLERIRAERKSVIDMSRAQLKSLEPRYAAADKLKVNAHLEALRAIEKRLDLSVMGCDVPTLEQGIDVQADDNFQVVSRLQIDLMVMAMACDLTRVGSLMWSRATSTQTFPFLGITSKHHDLSHEGNSNGPAIDKITTVNNFYAGEMAYLLQRLSEVPEGDGSMLDNTVVLWGNELGRGNNHSRHPIPLVMAGGSQGYFRMGRNLDYGDVQHNRLLVSLCNYMGLEDQETFGNLDDDSGPLPNLV